VILDKDLRERQGGRWEGLNDAEIRAQYPDAHRRWDPPDGEQSGAVADRVAAALQRIATSVAAQVASPDGLAVVVSHGAAIRLGMARLLGLPDELTGVLGPLANCAWSVVGTWRGDWRLLEHNAGTLPEPVLSDDR
jgi:probable phosphoglycerate mutase